MSNKMCPCSGNIAHEGDLVGKGTVPYFDAQDGVRPTNVKRIRVTCPECRRRLMSSVSCCHDGCCVYHKLPRHKKKGWWKRKRIARRTKGRRKKQ